MKLILTQRERLQSLGSFLVDELDSLVARIRGSWNVEHKDDDTHGHVHSDSLATGRLTFSDIVSDTVTVNSQQDNYNPAGLDTAALLRINTSLSTLDITGIQVPQDASGTVLDGRVLTIENVSTTTPIRLFNEHTSSLQRNRILLPWAPAGTETALQWYFVMPGSVTILIYNAAKTRWIVHGQTNEAIRMTASFSSSQNDYAPSGFRSSKYLSLTPTAAGLTISGFDGTTTVGSTNVPYPSTKVITNDGLYTFDLLHMSSLSATGNRIACPGGVRYRVYPRESVTLYRSASDTWKVAEKADQWVDVAYSAGNFTASAGNWTVDSGDVDTLCYQLDGNTMTVAFSIKETDVSSTPQSLNIAIPNNRVSARLIRNALAMATDAGTAVNTGFARVTAGGTTIQIFKDSSSTVWTATSSDNTLVSGEITFMVMDASASISEAHQDVAHGDTAHADVEHSDTAHSDVAHGDSHSDASHSDIAHGDVAAVAHTDEAHVDVAHSDSAGCNSTTSHEDSPHSDSPASHDDSHGDHTDANEPPFHEDIHNDFTYAEHGDTAHDDVAASHCDSPHADTEHTDSAHQDVAAVSHSDSAHTDGGHTDSHSDTAPHSDIAHVDVTHSDTAHSDSAHADVGYHTDTAHVDV